VNIASRTAGFLSKYFEGRVRDDAMTHPLLQQMRAALSEIIADYGQRENARAVRAILKQADVVNAFIEGAKPWELAKELGNARAALHEVCSVSLEAFRLLTLALKPILPGIAKEVETFLCIAPLTWAAIHTPLSTTQPIKIYRHLLTRVDAKYIEALIAANTTS
jgi:methionyl-tRNA synthetase